MAQSNVQTFIDALHELEDNRQVDTLQKCFHSDAELSNPNVKLGPGHDAPRRFWQSYRQNFESIHSEFRHVVANENAALLEWTSRGRTPEGNEFEYNGVSVLEFEGDRIKRFCAYFDPSDIGDQFGPDIRQHEREAAARQLQ